MVLKSVHLDEQSWKLFKKWCIDNNTNCSREIQRLINDLLRIGEHK